MITHYMNEVLDKLPSDMSGEVPTPAAPHLFQLNPEAKTMDTQNRELFHSNVAKLLFLSKHVRPDLQIAVWHSCV